MIVLAAHISLAIKLKMKYFIILAFSLISCAFAQEKRLELIIDEKLTLEDVFAAGFRPSSVYPSDDGDIRVWERKKVTLVFGDFRYDIDTEDVTFRMYDDNQISNLRITTTRENPLSVEEAKIEVRKFSNGIDLDIDGHIEAWLKQCADGGSMTMAGFGGSDFIEGVSVGGVFLTTLQPLDRYPVVLAFEIRWDYLGTGSAGGDRWGVKNVSPPGYDWDMSFEAWTQRVRAGKAGNRETNIPVERLGIKLPENLPEVPQVETSESSSRPKKTSSSEVEAEAKSSSQFSAWLYWLMVLPFLGILAVLFKVWKGKSQR